MLNDARYMLGAIPAVRFAPCTSASPATASMSYFCKIRTTVHAARGLARDVLARAQDDVAAKHRCTLHVATKLGMKCGCPDEEPKLLRSRSGKGMQGQETRGCVFVT